MDEARDIAKLALPFTAGTFLISCFSLGINHTYAIAAASLTLLSLGISLTLYRSNLGRTINLWEIVAIGVVTGIFIKSSDSLISLTQSETSWINATTAQLGLRMQAWIDQIPFQSEDTNAIIKALLTGNRKAIPKEVIDAFRASGASHILALSGLHLGIIYLIISKLTSIIGGSPKARIARSLICIAICTIYSLATGAGASIIRALIFIIIREVGKILHRTTDLKHTLLSCLLTHLIINPSDISSVGFQLSYAAIAGIAWIHPRISGLWPDEEEGQRPIMKRIWESASVSISCQLTTSPLAWFYFGTFPKYFLLTNLISLPLTALIIPIALLTTMLSAIGICPSILIQATELLVNALSSSLTIIAGL